MARIVLELYGVARRRAGRAEIGVEAGTLGEALLALARAAPALEGEVVRDGRLLSEWRASLDAQEFVDAPATPLPDGSRLLLFSAIAGG